MANYTKSFNFKNGVQVDTDNFVIDPNGLVGVGTTNPGKLLDVYGNARFSGVTSLTDANISGIVTVGPAILIDAASGVITATKFVGSATNLSGIVAITTAGWVQNTGTLSTEAKVGIGTTNPSANSWLHIYGTNDHLQLRVEKEGIGSFNHGVDSNGAFLETLEDDDIPIRFYAGGGEKMRVTPTGKVGIGSTQPAVELDVEGDVIVSGASTFGGAIDLNSNLDISGWVNIDGNIDADGELDVDGQTELDDVHITGISTFTNGAHFVGAAGSILFNRADNELEFDDNVKAVFGDHEDLKIYHTTSSGGYSVISESGTGQLIIGGNLIEFKNEALDTTYAEINSSGIDISGITTTENLNVTGVGTIVGRTHIGSGGTIFATLDDGKVGIGTSVPSVDFQIKKSSAVALDLVSVNSSSKIGIGQSVGAGNSSASINWDAKVFDIRNNDLGDFNMYLHKGNGPGIDTGSFNWLYGQGNTKLMSLTYGGNLGIGSTNPTETLFVKGDAKITGSLEIEGEVTYGSFTLPDPIESKVYATTGVSTFSTIHVAGGENNRIGIGSTAPTVGLDAPDESALFNKVGIGTHAVTDNELEVVGTLRATTIEATNNLFATGFTGTPDVTVNNITVNGKLTGGDGSGTVNVGILKGDGSGITNIHGYANVLNYGAKRNAADGFGSADDDTAAFQNAIDSGFPVFVPSGSYRIDGPLNLGPETSALIGAEDRPILVKMSGIGTPVICVGVGTTPGLPSDTSDLVRNTNTRIENIIVQNKIDGNYNLPNVTSSPGFTQAGVAVTGIGSTQAAIKDLTLNNIDVDNFPTGFYFRDVDGVKVSQCRTYVQDYNEIEGDSTKYSIGYHFDATRFNDDDGMVSPCNIELFQCEDDRNGTPGTGVTITASSGAGLTVTNSISYYVKGNDTRNISFVNCKSESAQYGYHIESTATDLNWDINITKPSVTKFKKYGIHVKNIKGAGALNITNGYLNGSLWSDTGIYADGSSGISISGSQFIGVNNVEPNQGIKFTETNNSSIIGNNFSNCKSGIIIHDGNYNNIGNNNIKADASTGSSSVGIGTTLFSGIEFLDGTGSTHNNISNNNIKGIDNTLKYYYGIVYSPDGNTSKNSTVGNIIDVDTVLNSFAGTSGFSTSIANIS